MPYIDILTADPKDMSDKLRIIVPEPKKTHTVICFDLQGFQHELELTSIEFYDLFGFHPVYPVEC